MDSKKRNHSMNRKLSPGYNQINDNSADFESGPNLSIQFNLDSWMSNLPDSTLVKRMTLPASHNAASYRTKNFIFLVKDYVECQCLTIYE